MRFKLLILFIIVSFNTMSQVLFYQTIFHGGVEGSGYSPDFGGFPFSSNINMNNIPIGSSIKKAYLFAFRIGKLNPITIQFNSNTIQLNQYNETVTGFNSTVYGGLSAIHLLDVTNFVSLTQTSYSISTSQMQASSSDRFSDFYLVILYFNPTFSEINFSILLNNQNFTPEINYSQSNINTINLANDVGFALSSGYICDDSLDGENAYINGNFIGSFGGNNPNSGYCGGPFGSFNYQNGLFNGMNGCNPNSNFNTYDVIKKINAELISSNSISIKYKSIQPTNNTNSIWANFLTYTTPCDTFSVKLLTEDTTVCRGNTVQLGVSGGNTSLSKPTYEWLPQKDLSCYNCPNPIFSGDSSQVYTVRIWNTDSCSKVLPVRVRVVPPPAFGQITTQNTVCGAQSGSIALASPPQDSLFFNNSFAGLTPLTLSNLGAGTDTLYLKDSLGCVSQDTLVMIKSSNNTQALFSVNPQTGAAPLSVTTDNQSTNATDYLWYFLNDSTTSFAPNMTFDTSGTYTVTLLAYQNSIQCADTFSLSVTVYDSLQIIVPNVITANGDGTNDVFSIQVNAPCKGSVSITNRWGNVVFTKDFATQGKEKVSLWDGSTGAPATKVDDGVYFYLFRITDAKGAAHKLEGFVSVVR